MKNITLIALLVLICCGLSSGQTTIFSDNMESLSGWTLSPATGWTLSSTQKYGGTYSARCDDVSPYGNSQNNYMTRSVNLSGYSSATLTFYIWQYTESGYDYVYAQYYSGTTWTTAWSRAGNYQSWSQQTATIPTSATQIRFWFKSDGSVVYSGAYVDDVVLTATGSATPTLAVSSTSWSPAAAGGTSSAVNVTNSATTSVIAYTVASNQSWLTVSSASGNTPGSFTMTAAANTGAARSATVTVTATTGGVSGSPKTISVSQAAGSGGQNDAGSGADAGGTFAAALQVNPGSWTGCYLDATDREDYYKFNVTSGQVIKVKITPPSNADYDLYLYNPSQAQKTTSERGAGLVDSVVFTADVSGYWYARAYEYSGAGNYSLLISVSGGASPTLAVSSTSWSPAAAGGTSSAVNVTNSATADVIAYTVASNQAWLTVSAASGNTPGSFTMTAAANSGAARSATVTVTATSPSGVQGSPKTITVSQSAAATPTLAVSSTSWSPAAAGGTSSTINVTNSGSSSVIAYTVASNQTWLTVSSASGNTPGSFTMTAAANSGAARSAAVTVTATTGGVSGSPQTIAVNQSGTSAGTFKYICLKAGQGDAAVLVSPTGKIALIDGSYSNAVGTTVWKFLRDSIRTHHLDYIFTSHLHSDHIGGTDLIIDSLCAHGMDSIINGVYDRGGAYGSGTDYTNYNTKAGSKRRTATLGQTFDMGGGLSLQVVCLKGKTISGDSVVIPSSEENGKSMGLLITYNGFKLISAGDIAGANSGDYKNVESILAPDIGQVNVLHVNHHSSASSTNATWVSTLNPQVSLISLGAGNPYGYPKAETLTRLTSDPGGDNHIYQTETGSGGTIPSGRGHVCNSNIWVEVNSTTYTVWGETYNIAKGGEIATVLPETKPVPAATGFAITAVSPNPVRNGQAVITYQTERGGHVTVELFNMIGQKVRTLADGYQSAGYHSLVWKDDDKHGLPNGVYFCRLAAAADDRRYESCRKILLMK